MFFHTSRSLALVFTSAFKLSLTCFVQIFLGTVSWVLQWIGRCQQNVQCGRWPAYIEQTWPNQHSLSCWICTSMISCSWRCLRMVSFDIRSHNKTPRIGRRHHNCNTLSLFGSCLRKLSIHTRRWVQSIEVNFGTISLSKTIHTIEASVTTGSRPRRDAHVQFTTLSRYDHYAKDIISQQGYLNQAPKSNKCVALQQQQVLPKRKKKSWHRVVYHANVCMTGDCYKGRSAELSITLWHS